MRIHRNSEDPASAPMPESQGQASVQNVVMVRVLFDGTDSVSALVEQ
jgi:hypothetical protein